MAAFAPGSGMALSILQTSTPKLDDLLHYSVKPDKYNSPSSGASELLVHIVPV